MAAPFDELIAVADSASRNLLVSNSTGVAGGPIVTRHGIAGPDGTLLGVANNPVVVSDTGFGAIGTSVPALPTGSSGVLGLLRAIWAALTAPIPAGTNVIGAVAQAGSTGTDASINAPALPVVGNNFANAGPFANYVLVKTVAANPARLAVEISNASGGPIAVMRDDGTAAGGAAPVNASVFPLAGGAGVGAQGAGWSSTRFKGRLQIYAPSGTASAAFIAVLLD